MLHLNAGPWTQVVSEKRNPFETSVTRCGTKLGNRIALPCAVSQVETWPEAFSSRRPSE